MTAQEPAIDSPMDEPLPGDAAAGGRAWPLPDPHPQFDEAVQAFRAWQAQAVQSGQSGSGQRGWRAKCVAKACELLHARTGRVTGAAVFRIVGFGSITDVTRDTREWLAKFNAARAHWSMADPLLQQPHVQDAVGTALAQVLASVRQEAAQLAKQELQAALAQLERDRVAAQGEVTQALAARDAALATSQAFERQRDQALAFQAEAERNAAKLQAQLDAQAASIEAGAKREQELRLQAERQAERTQAAVEQLATMQQAYGREIERLEGDQRRLLTDLDAAKSSATKERERLLTRSTLLEQRLQTQEDAARMERESAAQRERELAQQIERLHERVAALSEQLATNAQSRSTGSEVSQGELARLQAVLAQANEGLEQERDRAVEAETKLAAQRAEIRVLSEDRTLAMHQALQASERSAVAEARLASLQDEMQRLREKAGLWQREISELKRESSEASARVQRRQEQEEQLNQVARGTTKHLAGLISKGRAELRVVLVEDASLQLWLDGKPVPGEFTTVEGAEAFCAANRVGRRATVSSEAAHPANPEKTKSSRR